MGGSFRLKEITIRGFRGFGREPRTIDLSRPVTLIFGGNRSGKSSILNAVEWALFGGEVVKKDFIDERKGWLTRNRRCSTARVELALSTDDGEVRVCREMGSRRKRSGGTFYFIDEEGGRGHDQGALHARLGINARGFMNSTYLHQEVLRDILVSTPSVRKEALDRLLGVSALRELYNALKSVKKKDYEDRVSAVYEGLQRSIEMKAEGHRQNKRDALEKGGVLGIARNEYTGEGLAARCRRALDKVRALADKAGIEEPEITVPASPDGFEAFSVELDKIVLRLRGENPGAKSQKALIKSRSDLDEALSRYESRAGARKKLLEEREKLQAEGGASELEDRGKELLDRIEEINAELGRINRRLPVVNATIAYLEGLGDLGERAACPSCGQEVDPGALLADLQALTEDFAGETRELNDELDRLKKEKRQLEGKLSRLREIREIRLPALGKEISGILGEIGELLGREVGEDHDPEQLVRARLEEIDGKLDENRKVLEEYNEGIEEVVGDGKAAGVIHAFLKAQGRIEALEGITVSKEWEALDAARGRIYAELDVLEKTMEAVGLALDEVSGEKLRRAEESIVDYYRAMVERPDFDAITIDPSDHDVYAVRGDEREKVVTFFNQGDMNCVALSIFLALGGSEEKEGGPTSSFSTTRPRASIRRRKRGWPGWWKRSPPAARWSWPPWTASSSTP